MAFPEPGPRGRARADDTGWTTPETDPDLGAYDIGANGAIIPSARALPIDGPEVQYPRDQVGREAPTLDRPQRRHANAYGDREAREFDTTALHASRHGKFISHADYIAHSERYDYVWRSIRTGDRVLDVGAGVDLPLLEGINMAQSQAAKLIPRTTGGCYVGVDLNALKRTGHYWAMTVGEVDVTSDAGYQLALDAVNGPRLHPDSCLNGTTPSTCAVCQAASELARLSKSDYVLASCERVEPRGYTLIVCLEVIEHVNEDAQRRLLANLRDLLSPGGRIVLSTPVYDGRAMARNHVRELTVAELAAMVDEAGLRVVRRMGTFTAEPQLKAWLRDNRPDWLKLYEEIRVFHSAGYCSGLLAPLVPDISRNNVWDLELAP